MKRMQGKQLSKQNLEACFIGAISNGAKYVGLMIQLPQASEPEIIINPFTNFESKLEYYNENYNINLEHNHDNKVRIVGLTYGDSFEEIENDFLEY